MSPYVSLSYNLTISLSIKNQMHAFDFDGPSTVSVMTGICAVCVSGKAFQSQCVIFSSIILIFSVNILFVRTSPAAKEEHKICLEK